MANKDKTVAKVEETASENTATKAETAPKYVVEKLRRNCVELFGVTSSTFDGAMYGQDKEQSYSVDEVKNIINEFMRR